LPNLDKPSRIIEIGEAFYAIRYHKAMGIYYVYRNGDLLIGYIDPYEKNINSIDSLTLFSNIDKIRFQSIN
jgi:hypothetical protein